MLTEVETSNVTERIATPIRTTAQVEASRLNGAKGGRPSKKLVRNMAVIPGLLSARIAPFPSVREEEKTYANILKGLMEDFKPQSQSEILYIELLAADWLRYSRLLELRENHMDAGPVSGTHKIKSLLMRERYIPILELELDFLLPIYDAVRQGMPVPAWVSTPTIDRFIEYCGGESTHAIESMKELEEKLKTAPDQSLESTLSLEEKLPDYERFIALGLKGPETWRARFNGFKGSSDQDQVLWLELLKETIEQKKAAIDRKEELLNEKHEHLRDIHASHLIGQIVNLAQIEKLERRAMDAIERTTRRLERLKKRLG